MPKLSPSSRAESSLIDDVCTMIQDPLAYVRYAFPWGSGELEHEGGPDDWQVSVLSDIRDGLVSWQEVVQVAVASGNDIGKSALVAWIILWSMSTCPDCRVAVTANKEEQLRTKTWPELAKWYRLAINKHWFTLTATSLLSTQPNHQQTWRCDQITWSEHNVEAIAGLHNAGKRVVLLFDEASAIADLVWETAETAMLDKDTEVIWAVFGNPTRNSGRFKECFTRFRHRWTTRQIDSRDCKLSNKDKINQWIDDYGVDSDYVKVHVRGIFPSLSVKQFISVADVDAAYGRELTSDKFVWAPKIITCDPAWEGDDELVIGMRQGLLYSVLRVIPKNDNDMTVAALIADHEDQEKAEAVFIDAGYGTGIVSAGKTMGRNHWRLVWFAGASTDKGCLNKRAEMWRMMRDWLKDGGSIPRDQVLYNDLIGPEVVPRGDGIIQLESKKDMKRRKVPSPGRADALALSFAYPVIQDTRRRGRQNTGGFSNWNNAQKKQQKSDYQEVFV